MQRRVREKRYGDKLLGESGIFNPGMMRQLALEEIDGGQFLIYVLRQRYEFCWECFCFR